MTEEHMRPYWHVDLKWACGLLCTLVLSIALLMGVLYQITNREFGTKISTALLVQLFSREGADSNAGFDKVAEEIAKSPTGSFRPIAGFDAVITKDDLSLSPRDLRTKYFRQVTEPLYDKGVEGYAAGLTSDPEQIKKFKNDSFLLGLITADTHKQVGLVFGITSILAVLLAIGMIYFSKGAGRLVSPAVVLLWVSLLPALLLTVIHSAQSSSDAAGALPAEGPAAFLPSKDVWLPVVGAAQQTYLKAAALGLVLLIGAAVLRAVKKRQHP
jgi:hypothetical protein